MTTGTRIHNWLAGSTANTGEWITNTISLLTSVGLTPYNDTTTPTASASQDMGNITFGFPDTMQSTTPIYLRLNFTVGSGTPYVSCYVGQAKNSDGSIPTPNLFGQTNNSWTQFNSLSSYACYVDGTFAMVLGYGSGGSSTTNNCVMSLVIDRDRNTSGVAQSSGFLAEMPYSAMTPVVYSRAFYGPASADQMTSFVPALVPSTTANTSAEGPNVNVFRHYSMTPGVKPHVGMLTYFNAEFGALTPFTATVLGTPHTYLPMGYGMNYWSSNPRQAHCCAIRWE